MLRPRRNPQCRSGTYTPGDFRGDFRGCVCPAKLALDEERRASIEAGGPVTNPFLDDQLVLTSIGFLERDPRRSAQAVAAGWGVLAVDEAHHLEWSEAAPNREYHVVGPHSAVLCTLGSVSRDRQGLSFRRYPPESRRESPLALGP
jgi:hypothetical protein